MALDRMAQWQTKISLIVIATANPGPAQIPSFLQFGNDLRHGAFRDPYPIGNVAKPHLRVLHQAQQNVRMIGKESPTGGSLVNDRFFRAHAFLYEI